MSDATLYTLSRLPGTTGLMTIRNVCAVKVLVGSVCAALVKIRRRISANILTHKLLSASRQRSATSNLHCLSHAPSARRSFPETCTFTRAVCARRNEGKGCKVLTFVTTILALTVLDATRDRGY